MPFMRGTPAHAERRVQHGRGRASIVKARVGMAASPSSPDGSRPSRSGRPRHLPIRVGAGGGNCSSAPRAPSAPMASSSASTSKRSGTTPSERRHHRPPSVPRRLPTHGPCFGTVCMGPRTERMRARPATRWRQGWAADAGSVPAAAARPRSPLSPGLGTCRRHAASRALRTFFAFLSACPTASVIPPSSSRSGASATSPAVFAKDATRPTSAFCGRS